MTSPLRLEYAPTGVKLVPPTAPPRRSGAPGGLTPARGRAYSALLLLAVRAPAPPPRWTRASSSRPGRNGTTMVELRVNGRDVTVDAPPDMPLLWVLRDFLDLP